MKSKEELLRFIKYMENSMDKLKKDTESEMTFYYGYVIKLDLLRRFLYKGKSEVSKAYDNTVREMIISRQMFQDKEMTKEQYDLKMFRLRNENLILDWILEGETFG